MANILIDYFDRYTDLGWKIIPVRPQSKVPCWKKWNQYYNFHKSRQHVAKYEDCNLGLLLGDIIDIEGDTFEANKKIENVIKKQPHPKYISNKSVHHLFSNTYSKVKTIREGGIEFRSYSAQSIIPPSRHENGCTYDWIETNSFIIPELPDELIDLYKKLDRKRKEKKFERISRPYCIKCGKKFRIEKTRFRLEAEAFKSIGKSWSCRGCRDIDLRPLCRLVRKQLNF